MPRVTQYIRDEDFEAWKAIPNKSEFIHNALQVAPSVTEEAKPILPEPEDWEGPLLRDKKKGRL